MDNLVSSSWLVCISKLLFVGWLVFYAGSTYVYQTWLEKQLVQHEKAIDHALEKAGDFLAAKFVELKTHGMEFVTKHAGTFFQMLTANGGAEANPKAAAKPEGKVPAKAE